MIVNISFNNLDTDSPILTAWLNKPERHRDFIYTSAESPEDLEGLEHQYLKFNVGFPLADELIMDENPETAEGDTTGIYVYYELFNDILVLESVKVFADEAKDMASAHRDSRSKTLQVNALRDNVASFLKCSPLEVPMEMMKRATNADAFAKENGISLEQKVSAGHLVHVSFS